MQRGVDMIEEKEEVVQEIQCSESPDVEALARDYFNNGLYCSEALLKAFNETYHLGLPPHAYKIATGFGSGMGETGCACGAVTACVMVLGLVAGRNHKNQSEAIVFEAVKSLQMDFRAEYKSTCCRVLTKQVQWGSKEHTCQCEQIVGATAKMTQRLLETELKDYLPEGGGKKIPKKWGFKTITRRVYETFNRYVLRAK